VQTGIAGSTARRTVSRRLRRSLPPAPDRRDLTASAVGAGLTAFALFLFAPVPLQVAVAGELGFTAGQTAAWLFVGWSTTGLTSLWLTLRYRLPIPIVMSVPPIIYIGTLGRDVAFADLVGASVVAGLLILGLGLVGASGRMAVLIPIPIVLAMFAGSLLEWVLGIVEATFGDVVVAGSVIAVYAAARRVDHARLPPVPVAAAAGAVVLAAVGRVEGGEIAWVAPGVEVISTGFSLRTALEVGVPLAVLSVVLGTVQGIGFLRAEGFAVPGDRIAVAAGGCSLVNATLGATPASIALASTVIVGGPEAGHREGRYWAGVIASSTAVLIALAGGTIASVLGALPPSYVTVVAGLAVWSTFRTSLRGALSGDLRVGPVVAFLAAATPFSAGGLTSAFWAVPLGLVASVVAERRDLLRFWREARRADHAV
jgi:benzoate membrane transport protein